jgi:multidrug efflux pump subunit AcrB
MVRLRDVARVELGARDYSTKTYMDGKNAVSLRVFQLPGSNALETADRVYEALRRLKNGFLPAWISASTTTPRSSSAPP